MIAPVVGYTDPTISTSRFYRRCQGQRQRQPYTLPLVYDMKECTINSTSDPNSNGSTYAYVHCTSGELDKALLSEFGRLQVTAYDRLLSKIGDRASMGENLAEYRQTADMVLGRFNQLRDFTSAVRGKRYQQAAEILLMKEQPRKVTPIKAAADNWLEYWYGIRPLVGDIYSGLEILSDDLSDKHVTASASSKDFTFSVHPGSHARNITWTGKASTRYGAMVQVKNPNTYLLNRLGLLNPVQLAWQTTKYSLVLDWFWNVEQYLGTMTDFIGLELSSAYTTTAFTQVQIHSWYPAYGRDTRGVMSQVKRTTGISTPPLTFRGLKPFSAGKLAAAAALLYGEMFRLAKKSGKR